MSIHDKYISNKFNQIQVQCDKNHVCLDQRMEKIICFIHRNFRGTHILAHIPISCTFAAIITNCPLSTDHQTAQPSPTAKPQHIMWYTHVYYFSLFAARVRAYPLHARRRRRRCRNLPPFSIRNTYILGDTRELIAHRIAPQPRQYSHSSRTHFVRILSFQQPHRQTPTKQRTD